MTFLEAAKETFCPRVKVVSRSSQLQCSACLRETGEAYPILTLGVQWTTSTETDPQPVEGFVQFVLKHIESHWYCCEYDLPDDEEEQPLADLTVFIPALAEDILPAPPIDPPSHFTDCAASPRSSTSSTASGDSGVSGSTLCRVRRRVIQPQGHHSIARLRSPGPLRREPTKVMDIANLVQEAFDVYDRFEVLTDAHMGDVLNIMSRLPPNALAACEFVFTTSLSPRCCYKHDDAVSRHLAAVRCAGRQLVESASLKMRSAARRLKDTIILHDEDDSSDEDSHHIRRGWRMLTRALRLPEVGRLLRSGLYSPRYLERQLHEVLDSVRSSIARGFALTQL